MCLSSADLINPAVRYKKCIEAMVSQKTSPKKPTVQKPSQLKNCKEPSKQLLKDISKEQNIILMERPNQVQKQDTKLWKMMLCCFHAY